MNDIDRGKEKILKDIALLSEEQLEEVISLMSAPYPRKIGLYARQRVAKLSTLTFTCNRCLHYL